MRIVISAETDTGLESAVSHHFGRCPFFTVIEVEGGEIQSTRVARNPFYGSHSPGEVPAFINNLGADVMLAGGMGRRAVAMFERYGIKTVTGCRGSVGDSFRAFSEGLLSGSDPCSRSGSHQEPE